MRKNSNLREITVLFLVRKEIRLASDRPWEEEEVAPLAFLSS